MIRPTSKRRKAAEMTDTAMEGKGRWGIAAVGAIAVVGTLMFLVRLPPPPVTLSGQSQPAVRKPNETMVRMATRSDADLLLQAETELRDLRPLFLPTERNAALPIPRLDAGRTFLDDVKFKSILGEGDINLSKDLP